jgi:cytochrome P450/NADPH-cytochrome P450 reductase
VLEEAGKRARRPEIVSRLMWMRNRRYGTNFTLVHDLADRLIAERRRDPALGRRGDLLDVMLTAVDHKTGEMLGDDNIRSQLIPRRRPRNNQRPPQFRNMAAAEQPGGAHPGAGAGRRRARRGNANGGPHGAAQLRRTRADGDAAAVADRAGLRGPSARETVIGGRYRVTPDDILFVLLPILHRDPTVWDAPEAFRPERFEPDNVEKLPPNAWKPFDHGRRSCIGRGFALQEASLVLAMILQRFDLTFADPDYRLKVGETLTLKPIGLRVHARHRDLANAAGLVERGEVH